MTAAPWWPAGRPEVGDELAHDLAAVAMPAVMAEVDALLHGEKHMPAKTRVTKSRQRAADIVLDAACVEAVRQIHAGEPRIRRYCILRAALEAAELLLDAAS